MDFWKFTTASIETINNALSQYTDYFGEYPKHAFIRDRAFCESFLDQLDPDCRVFEVLFCEALPNDLYDTIFETPVPTPNVKSMFGYDVSWASCNHSAIYQPKMGDNADQEILAQPNGRWRRQVPRSELNDFGLFSTVEQAVNLQKLVEKKYPLPTHHVFCVYSAI